MVIGNAFDDRRKQDSGPFNKFLGDEPDGVGGAA